MGLRLSGAAFAPVCWGKATQPPHPPPPPPRLQLLEASNFFKLARVGCLLFQFVPSDKFLDLATVFRWLHLDGRKWLVISVENIDEAERLAH